MMEQEIKKAIENGESVWCVYKDKPNIYEIKAVEIEKVLSNTFLWGKEYYSNIKDVFKTKAEAEHYLHHANISRTETLPFLTWEEFKEKKCFYFTNYSDYYGMNTVNKEFSLELNVSRDKILLFSYEAIPLEEWEATETNFYKAYDECVKLFKQE